MKNRFKNRTNLYDREKEIRNKNLQYIEKDAQNMIETFRISIKRIKDRFEMVDLLYSQKKYEEASDVLRFQIVYAMSALDFFMHEAYCYGLLKIFRNEWPKTNRYHEYRVPLKLLEQAIYDRENIEYYLKETFIDLNSNYTFMSSGRMRELLNIITREDEFSLIERKLKARNVIRRHLRLDRIIDQIYERRNKITHQTDINHGKDDQNKINKKDVRFYIDVISNFVEALYEIIV